MAQQGRNEGSAAEEEEDIFSEGDVIDEKYKIVKRLGKGGYGEIYSARHVRTGDSVAVKVERLSKPGNLLEEERILRNLKGCKYVPRLLSTGRHKDQVNYMIMDLYADNLSSLRRKQADHRFSLITTALLAIQTIRSVKEVHDRGYLHRDIKPGNFVLGTKRTGNPRTVIIIDFGLSRRHFRPDGGVRPKRKTARWVGSRRYMSINTHLRKEQGRRDDLWSLLYVLVEFYTGTVPWAHLRGISNLDKVRDMKLAYNNERLVKGLPEEFLKFMNHLKTLRYEDRPNYDYLTDLMKSLLEKNNASEESLFDWEIEEARKREEYKTLYGEAPAPAGDYDDPFNPAPAESFEPKEAGGERDDSRRSGPFRQLGSSKGSKSGSGSASTSSTPRVTERPTDTSRNNTANAHRSEEKSRSGRGRKKNNKRGKKGKKKRCTIQ